MAYLFEGNKWNTLGVQVWLVFVHFHAYFSWDKVQLFCSLYSHSNPNSSMIGLESVKVRNLNSYAITTQ